MSKLIDLTGQHIGHVTVLKRADDKVYQNGNRKIMWECICDCQLDKEESLRETCILSHARLQGKEKCLADNCNCGCLTKKLMSQQKCKTNIYNLSGEYGIGVTSKGDEFWFDLEDYDIIKDYCWFKDKKGFIVANDKQHGLILLHRLVCNVSDTKIQVDHIKQRRYDNRKSQLRIATNAQNQMNTRIPSNNTTGIKGVYKQGNSWLARITVDGQQKHLGSFNTIEDAAAARKNAEDKYFGEWSYNHSQNMII